MHEIDRARFDWEQIDQNPFWTPDAQAAEDWAAISTVCANRARPSAR